MKDIKKWLGAAVLVALAAVLAVANPSFLTASEPQGKPTKPQPAVTAPTPKAKKPAATSAPPATKPDKKKPASAGAPVPPPEPDEGC
ncbi:MAG: hypothetical protein KJ621_00010 [Proteobacteria bacterium]|nr:hypothetical protein [Pseudomonadota bacterium]